jgi:plastocyanin
VAGAILIAACGGSASVDPTAAPTPVPSPAAATPPPVTAVTITAAGVSPVEITVAAGTQVSFTNNDTAPHDVAGGPDLEHPDCREIDAVGFLVPGQTKRTAPLTTVRTCDYHDHQNHSPVFNGRIVIR